MFTSHSSIGKITCGTGIKYSSQESRNEKSKKMQYL